MDQNSLGRIIPPPLPTCSNRVVFCGSLYQQQIRTHCADSLKLACVLERQGSTRSATLSTQTLQDRDSKLVYRVHFCVSMTKFWVARVEGLFFFLFMDVLYKS